MEVLIIPNWVPEWKIITFYSSGNTSNTYLYNLDSTTDQKLISLPEFH